MTDELLPDDGDAGDAGPGDEPIVDPPPKRRGRPPGSKTKTRSKPGPRERAAGRRQNREQAIEETIVELADLADELRARGSAPIPDDLADIARRDGRKMAAVLVQLADTFQPFGLVVDYVFGGPLAAARAFGPFLRRLWQMSREARVERDRIARDFAERLMAGNPEPRDGDRQTVDGAVFQFTAETQTWNEIGPEAAT